MNHGIFYDGCQCLSTREYLWPGTLAATARTTTIRTTTATAK